MDYQELLKLVPKHKFDIESVNKLSIIGYPIIAPILPELLEWCFDGNWPVAQCLDKLLIGIGKPLAVYIKPIFMGNDDTGKYFILSRIISYSKELSEELYSDLIRMANLPTQGEIEEGVNEISQEILDNLESLTRKTEINTIF